jgi:hypothetical protein
LLDYQIPEIQQTLTKRDSMLYALGVGLGAVALDERQLRFVYEKDLLALPTMAVARSCPMCRRLPKAECRVTTPTWFGMLAAAKTPKPILNRVHDAFATVINTPELRAQLESQGAEPGSGSALEFGELIRREYQRNAKVVKISGAKID